MPTLVKQDSAGLDAGIERLAAFFAERTTRAGLLARRALGRPTSSDDALRDRLVREMRGETRFDGSLGGAAVPTIWRAIELMELGHGGDQSGTIRVMGWVLALQEKPGAFGEGCTDQRHARKLCEHFVGGFFSLAPPNQKLSPVSLPNGKVFRSEGAARFATSCLALRAALMAGYEHRPGVARHLASLELLCEEWTEWKGYFAPDTMISSIPALALAPPKYREALRATIAMVCANLGPDGTWPEADLFHTLDALTAAAIPEASGTLRRAVTALLERQRPDGSFGSTAREERALIGLRALLQARFAA